MSYRCPYGCIRYRPDCDGCDSATESRGYYQSEKSRDHEVKERVKAGLAGLTLKEFREIEEDELI